MVAGVNWELHWRKSDSSEKSATKDQVGTNTIAAWSVSKPVRTSVCDPIIQLESDPASNNKGVIEFILFIVVLVFDAAIKDIANFDKSTSASGTD